MFKLPILFQFVLNDLNGWFHWHRCRQHSDIIGGDTVSFFKFYALYLVYIVLCVLYMVVGLTYMGSKTLASSSSTPYFAYVPIVFSSDLMRPCLRHGKSLSLTNFFCSLQNIVLPLHRMKQSKKPTFINN